MAKLIVILPNGTIEQWDLQTLQDLQTSVGGYLEFHQLGRTAHCYINEEGKRLKLQHNPVADKLIRLFRHMPQGDGIVGPMVVCGSTDSDGRIDSADHDCPENIESLIRDISKQMA